MNIKSYDFYYQIRILPFVDAIWLYGSRARKENAERSDIDLAIICPKASQDDWRKIREIIDEADTLFEIDCIRFDHLSPNDPLRHEIEKDKEILFERAFCDYSWYASFLDLGEAIDQLEEMVLEPENRTTYVREATIQRFEFCVELFWKVLKKICETEGHTGLNSPKSTLQKAYAMRLIDDEHFWLDMMEDRNLTSHTYRRLLAREIYSHIKIYHPVIKETYKKLKQKYNV